MTDLKWKPYDHEDPSTHPTEPGTYAAMIAGDSESIDGHEIYCYPDFQAWAEVFIDDGELRVTLDYDQPVEALMALYGPIIIPKCDCL
jgi:hypothetical protein